MLALVAQSTQLSLGTTRRRNDPLGLGLERPAPLPDTTYDKSNEDVEGGRSLLSAQERIALDSELGGTFMTPKEVRAVINENCTRSQLEEGGLDPDFILLIDTRINYKLFIAGDNVYTREELFANFPFQEFAIQPESIFCMQEVGVFEARVQATGKTPLPLEYSVRDAGDERIDFSPAEDLVRAACGGPPPRTPTRIVKTKIYVGREPWSDFLLQMRFYRGAIRLAKTSPALALALASPLASPAQIGIPICLGLASPAMGLASPAMGVATGVVAVEAAGVASETATEVKAVTSAAAEASVAKPAATPMAGEAKAEAKANMLKDLKLELLILQDQVNNMILRVESALSANSE